MSAIPCKRPKVTVDNIGHTFSDRWETYAGVCHVPACGWRYENIAKTDVEENAVRHRHGHRDAVPAARIEKGPEYDVYCEPCGGHRRTFGTRTNAQAWLDYHLSAEHGLVTCS